MRTNKITPKQWLEFHPYKTSNNIDKYYTEIANRIKQTLLSTGIMCYDDDITDMSLRLAAWFEDIISQTHIWKTFINECEKRYGKKLPFYPIGNNYHTDGINLEDIYFLLWHCLQQQNLGEQVINPENPGIQKAGNLIYEILSKESKNAPQNPRMQDFFQKPTPAQEDFLVYRAQLEWFHFNCYFSLGNLHALQEQTYNVLADYEGNKPKEINMLCYRLKVSSLFQARSNLLSLPSYKWLSLIWEENKATAGPWKDIETLPESYYLYLKEDERCIYVQSFTEEKQILAIDKESLDLQNIKDLKAENSVINCMLVKYGDTWWQNGVLFIVDNDNELEATIAKENSKRNLTNEKLAFQDFMKANEGKFFVFCRNKRELSNFLSKKMGYKNAPGVKLPAIGREGAVLMATPQTGLHIQLELTECICSPDNPFYQKEEAKELAFLFFINPEVIPYELSCLLQDKGMLPDAGLNSLLGREHGQQLLQSNARFLTDYFFQRYREKDYDDPLLKKWL